MMNARVWPVFGGRDFASEEYRYRPRGSGPGIKGLRRACTKGERLDALGTRLTNRVAFQGPPLGLEDAIVKCFFGSKDKKLLDSKMSIARF
jgi:hypothetical protein